MPRIKSQYRKSLGQSLDKAMRPPDYVAAAAQNSVSELNANKSPGRAVVQTKAACLFLRGIEPPSA
jgi:hypothetical protein